MLRSSDIMVVVTLGWLGCCAPPASAGTIWQWTHQAEGEGWANVYDGGPVRYDSEATLGPDDDHMSFVAADNTRPGSFGASYGTGGISRVYTDGDQLMLHVFFSTSYTASSHIAADRTGGEGHGWMTSVVEFVAPADDLLWSLTWFGGQSPGFSGSTHLLVENVSQSTVLLDVLTRTQGDMVLHAERGDLVRVSLDISGEGSFPAASPGGPAYYVDVVNEFTVPEVDAVGLLMMGVALIGARRRKAQSW